MSAIFLWHGAVGILDELLACGIFLGLVLVVFFIASLFAPKDHPASTKNSSGEHEKH